MDVRMAIAYADETLDVTAFCVKHHISRQTFYKFRRRFVEGGVEALQERSRAPHRSPNATPAEVEEVIVRVRKQLGDDGADNGPDSIWSALADALAAADLADAAVPSISTVARILTRRGLVTPVPQRRPKSATHRFVYARPNECWQSDYTEWHLTDGTLVAIAGTLDDHSRVVVGLDAAVGEGTAVLVWSVMESALQRWGVPQRSLTDNGVVYSGKRRNFVVEFERNLGALGVETICSRSYHPQTCGKIERFWQTLKKWLTAHGPHDTIEALRADLTVFVEYYNTRRPHRSLGRRTPAAVFAATASARPADRPIPDRVIVAHLKVAPTGFLTVGVAAVIGLGRAWAGHHITAIRDGQRITLLDGHRFVRAVTVQPGKSNYPTAEDHDYRARRPRPTTG
ncbi:integrase core domain-containing protein [Jatrophihabitans sp. YIM 134969]